MVSFVAVAVAIAVAAAACSPAPPPQGRRAAEVARLAAAIPLIEELRVTDFENSAWCRNLGYERGAFGFPDEVGCDRDGTVPFDPAALVDHGRLAAAITASGVATDRLLTLTYDDEGSLEQAWFALDSGSVLESWHYVYDRAGTLERPDIAGLREFARVGDSWWFVHAADD
jgi:hypothetical protein